ncbi:MAG: sulfotransferase, partial [Actinobacteria bacterium]|nr:sulfotransferase [Actinomycetota bacterium]
VTVNALIGTLSTMGVPSARVRYEDLVRQPQRELMRVAAAEGLAAADVDFGFLTPGGVAVAPTHLVAGGRIRLTDGVLPLRLDDAWRREMPPPARRAVTAVTLASRLRYGYR